MNTLFLIPTAVTAILAVVTYLYLQNRKIINLKGEIKQLNHETLLRETEESEKALAYLQGGNHGVPLTLALLAPGLAFSVKKILVGDANNLYLLVTCAEFGMWEGDRFLCIHRHELVLDRDPEEKNQTIRFVPFSNAPNRHDTLTVVHVHGQIRLAVTVGTVTRQPTAPLSIVPKPAEVTAGDTKSAAA